MKVLGSKVNFLGLEKENSNYYDSKIVVVPVPFEKNIPRDKGTAAGPFEVLKASRRIERYDEEQNSEICFEEGIATLSPLDFSKLSITKSLDKLYTTAARLINDGKFIAALGGEHTIAYPFIKAYYENYTGLSILQIDAHSGLKDKALFSHECVMAYVAEFCERIVQVGVRAQSKDENEFRKRNGIRTFYAREIKMGMYGENWQEMAARILSENVYITFDLDGFDPSVLSATGRPEPGGLFWDETLNLLKIVCHDKNIVGIDITGLVPSKSNGSSNYTAAKLLYKILNYASM